MSSRSRFNALVVLLVFAVAPAGAATWVQWHSASGSPPKRLAHTAIYDSARHRVVIFGGLDVGGPKNDTWALTLQPVPAWSLVSPQGALPAARSDHIAVYDPVGDRMLVFGGHTDPGLAGDVWALSFSDPIQWTQLAPGGTLPAARLSHAGAYDASQHRLLIHGGHDGTLLRDDLWELSLGDTPEWHLIPAGFPPSARRDAVAIFDPARARFLLHGGYAGEGFLSDVWVVDETGVPAWEEVAPSGVVPAGTITHAGAHDPPRDRFIQFGGSYGNETWALPLEENGVWEHIVPAGARPPGRIDHTLTYVPDGDRLVVFGGHTGGATLGDTWTLPLSDVTAVRGAPAPAVLSLWPNPASDHVTFRIAQPLEALLTVHDVRGRVVRRLVVRPSEGRVWDLRDASGHDVPAGVYFCVMESERATARQRLVVIR
jgi:hypothetical protein